MTIKPLQRLKIALAATKPQAALPPWQVQLIRQLKQRADLKGCVVTASDEHSLSLSVKRLGLGNNQLVTLKQFGADVSFSSTTAGRVNVLITVPSAS